MAVSDFIRRTGQAAKIGLAARDLKRAATDNERRRARQALAGLFADARGVTMKIGQLMAGGDDGDVFNELVTGVDPLPLSEVLPTIEAALGRPPDDVFSWIAPDAAAASLGQVHHARLKDGSDVAVKVQYPHIAAAVDAEMRLFGLMPGIGPVRTWGFDLGGYKQALRDNMARELDYRNEAARQQAFRTTVTVPGLVVPQIYDALSGAHVLVQSWEDGVQLDQVLGWSPADRRRLGRILLETLFRSLFVMGEVHGDPHAGNVHFRNRPGVGPEVVLMDFGCTVPIDRTQRLALLQLILAVHDGTVRSPLQSYQAIGFDAEKLALIAGPLATLSHILLAPFAEKGVYFVKDWDLKARFEALLGENRWWFRAAGAPSTILLLRAFQGLAQQLADLQCGHDWFEVLSAAVPAEILAEARTFILPSLPPGLQVQRGSGIAAAALAKSLRVCVKEGPRTIVDMSMPAEAALRIDSLIPDDVIEHLRATNAWDVEAILAGVRARGIEPQEILTFEKGPKSYRIWLE